MASSIKTSVKMIAMLQVWCWISLKIRLCPEPFLCPNLGNCLFQIQGVSELLWYMKLSYFAENRWCPNINGVGKYMENMVVCFWHYWKDVLFFVVVFFVVFLFFFCLAFYSKCETLFVKDNILSETIGIFCFWALFYPNMKIAAKNCSDLCNYYGKLIFWEKKYKQNLFWFSILIFNHWYFKSILWKFKKKMKTRNLFKPALSLPTLPIFA